MNQIKNSNKIDDKVIGCSAIILVGLSYKKEKKYLINGLNVSKKISNLLLVIMVFQNHEILNN